MKKKFYLPNTVPLKHDALKQDVFFYFFIKEGKVYSQFKKN